MRAAFLAFLALVSLTSCVSVQVAGRFRATSGESIAIQRDGLVVFDAEGAREVVGVIADQRDLLGFVATSKLMTVDLNDTDPRPGIMPAITFSADRKSLAIDWRRAAGNRRPTDYRKE
jgi:hypothetical protein